MKLRDILAGEKQINEYGSSKASPATEAAVARQIRALVPGQLLQGEVVAKNGQEVQLKLLDSMVLSAKLEQNMNFDIGKLMTFEVKNNGKSLLLSPLFTNLTNDANVLKALDMAMLPVNETTVDMTSKLMEAGLPIDKNTLQQVYREINAYNDAEVMDIVNLHKMNLPVNEKNVQQLLSYRNFSNQMVDGMREIWNSLPQVFQGMLQEGNVEGAARLYHQLMLLVQEGAQGAEGTQGVEGTTNGVTNGAQASVDAVLLGGAQGVNAMTDDTVQGQVTANGLMGVPNVAGSEVNGANGADVNDANALNNANMNNANAANSLTGTVGNSSEEGMLANQPISGDASQQVSGANAQHLANQANQLEAQWELPVNWKEDGKEFMKLIHALQKQWTLKPEAVADKEKVDELYQRIDKHIKQLNQVLESTGATESTAFKAINTMEQKLDFMQQMNQIYQFVQLPLKLHYGDAQGDLYVYTNKKSLIDNEGEISALLHLDMENLGPVDVYVAMQHEKVNTKFYVSDDVMDFLMEHMDILTSRLQRRGYQYSCEMIAKEEESQGVNSIELLRKQEEESIPLAQYAFDVRT